MKKLLSICLLALTAFGAQAQKGSVLVFGDVNYSSNKDGATPELHTQTIGIRPGVGYQFSKHFTAGVVGGVGLTTEKYSNTDKYYSTQDWEAGVFLRYTKNLSKVFAFYTQLDGTYGSRNKKYDNGKLPGQIIDNEYKYDGFQARLTPAIAVFVCKGLALNFGIGGLGFSSVTQDVPGAKAATSFDFTFGKQAHIGISKNFGGKKHACGGECCSKGKKGKKSKKDDSAYEDEDFKQRSREKKVKGDDL